MEKCKIAECDRPIIEDYDTCILHCKKGDYQDDKIRNGFLYSFYLELIKYIVISLKSLSLSSGIEINENHIKAYFQDNNTPHPIKDFIKSSTIVFTKIFFPARDSRDRFDYEKILEKLGNIHFNFCEFYTYNLDLKIPKVFFQDCVFNTNWFLFNYKTLESANNVIYQNCKFLYDVNTVAEDYPSPVLENDMFCDCEFKCQLSFDKLLIKGMIFKNNSNNIKSCKDISISRCTIESKLIINSFNIETLKCEYTTLKSKFEFKNNFVKSFYLYDSNFLNLLNSSETDFDKFQIEKCIFDDYVGFQKCKFGEKENVNKNSDIALFRYVTFKSFVNFRDARFFNGLDIQDCNFTDPPNFLNAFIAFPNTNRETYRIIKYSFDRVGNYIAANTFFELEIKKYRDELKAKKGNISTKLLLGLYGFTSNFGQSFLRPLILIFVTSIFYLLLVIGFENGFLYRIYPAANEIISLGAKILNLIAKGILPFRNILKEGMEFISLFFYIIYTILVWLVILAIKRKTKR